MKTAVLVVGIFTSLSLVAQSEIGATQLTRSLTALNTYSPVEIQTFSASCYGKANGSLYVRADEGNWKLTVFHNGIKLNTYTVSGLDTFLSGMRAGSYTFDFMQKDVARSFSKTLSQPSPLVGAFKTRRNLTASPGTVSFVNTSTGAYMFAWEFGDGEQSAEVSPVHYYSAPGTYTVTLSALNRAGAVSIAQTVVTIPAAEAAGMQ